MSVRVLIIEDQPGMSGDIKEFLETKPHIRIAAIHEQHAVLARLQQFTPGLIILASQLGKERGLAILRSVREDRLGSKIPLFIVTGVTDRSILKEAFRWRINECFLKPFEKQVLWERLVKWLPEAEENASQVSMPAPASTSTPVPDKSPDSTPTPQPEVKTEDDFSASLGMAQALITKVLAGERLQMPVLPEIAMQVQKRLQDPHIGLEEIAEIIKPDVAIASKILSIANSSYYGAKDKIRDLNAAVIRIGLTEIQNIVQMVCGHQLFQVPMPHIKQFMQRLWEHSLSCAYANHLVAQKKGLPEAEQYFLLGLIHDIGKVFLVHLISKVVEQNPSKGSLFTDNIIAALVQRMHNPLGEMITTKWGYPAAFIEVTRHHDDEVEKVCCNPTLAATYYSNLLTRKLGYSFESFSPSQEANFEKVRDYLGLTAEQHQEIEVESSETLQKIKGSFFSL